ncbi:peroxisomal biogenesis factor 19 [Galendromus occidentalis]|uniref:Peroxin-19 n=1 Tax=Galendromus occidentalis TaxID=34638 RepID=A0AAJ6QUJ9_9ACAR|nr:peroxisomal biogenesis factor 19 [Galendromus occidentalis]
MAESKPEVDSELDNLLDSALNEFDAQKESESQKVAQASAAESSAAAASAADLTDNPAAFGLNIDQMRESLSTFMKGNPMLNAENAGEDSELAKAMQETLGLFTKSLDRFQEQGGEFNPEDFLSDVFKNMNVDGAEPLGDMLSHGLDEVLTKSLLYPGLKDIHDSLPKWIDENREKLSEDELAKVESQNALVKQIIEEYDSEKDDGLERK